MPQRKCHVAIRYLVQQLNQYTTINNIKPQNGITLDMTVNNRLCTM